MILIAEDLRRERDKPAPKLNYRRHAAQLPQQLSDAHQMTSDYKVK